MNHYRKVFFTILTQQTGVTNWKSYKSQKKKKKVFQIKKKKKKEGGGKNFTGVIEELYTEGGSRSKFNEITCLELGTCHLQCLRTSPGVYYITLVPILSTHHTQLLQVSKCLCVGSRRVSVLSEASSVREWRAQL